jgi:hypothetical protein
MFRWYQGQHFQALAELMLQRAHNRNPASADLLQANLQQQLGLHEQASEALLALAATPATLPPEAQDRAWFYLAQMRHQRGQVPAAQAALDSIRSPLVSPPGQAIDLQAQAQLLRAQLLLQRQEPAAAARLLAGLVGTPAASTTLKSYARYNLAVALVQSGQAPAGWAELEALGQAPATTDEQKNLRDRANLALGVAALQGSKPREARVALQRVRLNGPHANAALLGYGWAALNLNDPQLAQVPWAELVQRPASDPAVLEAHIALPYALSETGAYRQALDGYAHAVQVFTQQQLLLDQAINTVRSADWLTADLQALPGSRAEPALLSPLLASHSFDNGLQQLQDLRFVAAQLRLWQDQLAVQTDLLDQHQAVWGQRLPPALAQLGAAALPTLQLRHMQNQQAHQAAQAQPDGWAYATAPELALRSRLAVAQAALAGLVAQEVKPAPTVTDPAPSTALAARLRLLQGTLQWQLAQSHTTRHAAAGQALADSSLALARAQTHVVTLQATAAAEPARQAQLRQRIAALNARLQLLLPQAAALQQEARAELQEVRVADLQSQKDRIATHLTQARLATAQILDRAQLSQRGEPGAAKP